MTMANTQASNTLTYELINNGSGKARLNELYRLNTGQSANSVMLEVKPKGGAKMPELHSQVHGNANKDNFTIALAFQGHLLDERLIDQIVIRGEQAENWTLTPVQDGKEITLYFLFQSDTSPETCRLVLDQLAVNTNYSTGSTMVLKYTEKEGKVIQCQQLAITVLNHQGIEQSPFTLWLDTPKLSTRQDDNENLKLRLLNSSHTSLSSEKLRLQLEFDIDEGQLKSPEALMTENTFRQRFESGNGVVAPALGTIEAKVVGIYKGLIEFNPAGDPLSKASLEPGEFLSIELKRFNVSQNPGATTLTLRYFNIDNFWDGELSTTVQRTAYLESNEHQVQITKPIGGQLSAQKVVVQDAVEVEKGGVIQASDGNLAINGGLMAKALQGESVQVKDGASYIDLLPAGTIVMWSGGKEPPPGWALCNGKGTVNGKKIPDLSGRFVMGMGSKDVLDKDGKSKPHEYEINTEGGEDRVKLTPSEMPKHYHDLADTWFPDAKREGKERKFQPLMLIKEHKKDWEKARQDFNRPQVWDSPRTSERGADKFHENLPPYYVLAYIIKK